MTTASWSGITSANWCIFSDTPRTLGNVALYRDYNPPANATANADGSQRVEPAQDAANVEAARRALDERRDRVRGDGSWFTPDRIADIKRDRGLER